MQYEVIAFKYNFKIFLAHNQPQQQLQHLNKSAKIVVTNGFNNMLLSVRRLDNCKLI